jgi:uncharacterized membrane protein YidH (DUF202 family)
MRYSWDLTWIIPPAPINNAKEMAKLRDVRHMDNRENSAFGRTAMAEIRLSATLLFAGVLISVVVGLFHPANAAANAHPAIFAEYAASTIWAAVHLGQFIGMAVLVAGLVVLDLLRGYGLVDWVLCLHLLPWPSMAYSRRWMA